MPEAVPQITVDLITTPPVTTTAGSMGVTVDAPSATAAVSVDPPSITLGVPGPAGPTGPIGPAGLVKVNHGSDPSVARPDAPLVYWVGSVQPTNADPDDLLMLKG